MPPVSIIVAGTRTFNDYELLSAWLNTMRIFYGKIRIVSGGADGADTLAIKYAKRHLIPKIVLKADWNKHGRAAGPIRNREMAEEASVLVAFWDGQSRGTKNMIEEAIKRGLQTHIVYY